MEKYKEIRIYLHDGSVVYVIADHITLLMVQADDVRFFDDRYPNE